MDNHEFKPDDMKVQAVTNSYDKMVDSMQKFTCGRSRLTLIQTAILDGFGNIFG
jgi:hypothetical protein